MSLLGLLLLAQVAAAPAGAADTEQDVFAQTPNWTILRNRATADCRMGTFYRNGTQALIYFNTANRRADFTFSNEAWSSPRVGEKKKIQLLFFPTKRFGSGEGTVVSSRNGDGVAINLGFADGLTLLSDFARATTFNLSADNVSLGTFPLEGSSKAIDLLMRCAVEVAAEGATGDPFKTDNN